jgi:cytoskeletal protein CcmA (bactofilin family)
MFGKKKNTTETSVSNIANSLSHNIIVANTVINGDLEIAADIRIDGIVNGNLKSSAKVVLGAQAKIEGNLQCAQVLIEGKVTGNVTAQERVHLLKAAIITGDIKAPKLIIENGAQFNGSSIMQK